MTIYTRLHRGGLSKAAPLAITTISGLFAALLMTNAAEAHSNKVSISVKGGQRCIVSNGLPNHATGQFPNRGNPNTISQQNVNLCVTTSPRKGSRPRKIRGSIGIGVNGVQFRPGTADYYDPNSRRGFSRNRASGWNLDGLGAADQLGMDHNNAHVDNRGLYHYHGISNALKRSGKGTLIGWAADGFEIHYEGAARKSSYQLKPGNRSNPPGGKHTGTYVQDWQFVSGSGNLDQCNGGTKNGKFVYFATDTFPFLPHCLWGEVAQGFEHRGGPGQAEGRRPGRRQGAGRQGELNGQRGRGPGARNGQQRPGIPGAQGGNRRPPRQALAACQGKVAGSSCAFNGRRNHRVVGSCRPVAGNANACVPTHHRRAGN